jgi:uncharacterized peroxidase-related enzyme
MAWIRMIEESEAGEELRAEYQQASSRRGAVANILKVHSLNPAVLRRHLDLYVELMFGRSPLTRREREIVAVAVSASNRCHY